MLKAILLRRDSKQQPFARKITLYLPAPAERKAWLQQYYKLTAV